MIAHTSWFNDGTATAIRYTGSCEGTAMGMAEPSDPRTDTSSNCYYRSYPTYIVISNYDAANCYAPKPWLNPCKFKDDDPRRPIDPTPFSKHRELSIERSIVYARRTAPNWKPRTAILMRSNPRWRSGRWKAKT